MVDSLHKALLGRRRGFLPCVNLLDRQATVEMDAAFIARLNDLLTPVRNCVAGVLAPSDWRHRTPLQAMLYDKKDADDASALVSAIETELTVRLTRMHCKALSKALLLTLFFMPDGFPQGASFSAYMERWPGLALVLQLPTTEAAPQWIIRTSQEEAAGAKITWADLVRGCTTPVQCLGFIWHHDAPDLRPSADAIKLARRRVQRGVPAVAYLHVPEQTRPSQ